MHKSFLARYQNPLIFCLGLIIFLWIYLSVLEWPLQGIHSHRQADTLFSAYSYCFEGTEFLKPKIAHRNDTSGVSIGEFPLFSYLLSLPCKATGVWSETLPKYISLVLAILCTFSWGMLVRKKMKIEGSQWIFGSVFFFMITHLIHLTIPIPDAFASLLMALAGLTENQKALRRSVSYLLFALAFAIRPYFFILGFFIYDTYLVAFGAIAICTGFYLFWYKSWIQNSELDYYSTQTKSISDLISEMPRALKNLPAVFLRNHMNFVLLLPFIQGIRRHKKLTLLYVLSWIVVLMMKGDHYVNHNYYLGAASVFAAILIYLGILNFKVWQRNTILVLSILVGIANTQHLWTDTKQNYNFQLEEAIQKQNIPPEAHVVAYVGLSPQFLYWAKRTGWLLPESKANETCPAGIEYKIIMIENQAQILPCP